MRVVKCRLATEAAAPQRSKKILFSVTNPGRELRNSCVEHVENLRLDADHDRRSAAYRCGRGKGAEAPPAEFLQVIWTPRIQSRVLSWRIVERVVMAVVFTAEKDVAGYRQPSAAFAASSAPRNRSQFCPPRSAPFRRRPSQGSAAHLGDLVDSRSDVGGPRRARTTDYGATRRCP